MNQEEFLQQLATALAPLSDMERARALDYYREMICDELESGKTEQEIIAGFGSVQAVAAQIMAENGGTVPAAPAQPARPDTAPAQGSTAQGQPGPAAAQPAGAQNNAGAFGETVFSPKDEIHSIIIDAHNINLQIRPVSSGPLRVHIHLLECDLVNVTEEGGVYAFSQKMQYTLYSLRDLFSGPRNILVEVPADYCGDLQARTTNARLIAENISGLQNVQLETSNAAFEARGISCVNFGAKTNNGSLTLDGLAGSNCIAETRNGRIRADRCAFPGMLHLYTSNGTIQAPNITSNDIELSSQNGAISAVVCGDMREYAIRSHTSNGSNTLPPELAYPGQNKFLNVSTSNARIDVRFAQIGG